MDCHPQTLLYSVTTFHTGARPDKSDADTDSEGSAHTAGAFRRSVLTAVAVTLSLCVCVALVVAGYRYYKAHTDGGNGPDYLNIVDFRGLWEYSTELLSHCFSTFSQTVSHTLSGDSLGRRESVRTTSDSQHGIGTESSAHGLAMSTFSDESGYRPPTAPYGAYGADSGNNNRTSSSGGATGVLSGLWSSASKSLSALRSTGAASSSSAGSSHAVSGGSVYNALPRAGSAFVVEEDDDDIQISL